MKNSIRKNIILALGLILCICIVVVLLNTELFTTYAALHDSDIISETFTDEELPNKKWNIDTGSNNDSIKSYTNGNGVYQISAAATDNMKGSYYFDKYVLVEDNEDLIIEYTVSDFYISNNNSPSSLMLVKGLGSEDKTPSDDIEENGDAMLEGISAFFETGRAYLATGYSMRSGVTSFDANTSQVSVSYSSRSEFINTLSANANNGQSVVEGGVLDITDITNENNVKWYTNAEKGHVFNKNDGVAVTKAILTPTTIEWWMKTESTSGTYTILSNGSTLIVAVVDGNLRYKNNTIEFTTNGVDICGNTMKHFAVVIDNDKAFLYINGSLVNSYDISGAVVDSTKLYIGCENISGNTVKNGFFGEIADLRIWNMVRSTTAISNNKDKVLAGNETGLVGYWKLDQQFYLNDLSENFIVGTTNNNIYPEAEEYYQNCMGYKDFTSNNNHGVFFSSGWYNLENIITDYTIIQISDTQSYMFGHPEYFNDMYSWMNESKKDLNIVMVDHLGDVCQDSTALQWNFTYEAFMNYLNNSIPFNIALGNHDYFSPYTGIGAEFRDIEYFSEKFSIDVVREQFNNIDWARYGGSFDNYNADNLYMFLEAGTPTIKYMVIILEYGPRQEIINWASELVEKYSDHKVIILTHCYYDTFGTRSTFNTRRTTSFADSFEGTDIWNEFIDKYDNIVMINCGHSQNNQVQAYVNTTSKGTQVVQILSDPSAMLSGFPSDKGIIELMCFTNDGKMHTYYYSPVEKMFCQTQFECTFNMADALGLA